MQNKNHGNIGNANAMKGDSKKASFIQIRCTQEEKAQIVRKLRNNEKLSEFILSVALQKARERG